MQMKAFAIIAAASLAITTQAMATEWWQLLSATKGRVGDCLSTYEPGDPDYAEEMVLRGTPRTPFKALEIYTKLLFNPHLTEWDPNASPISPSTGKPMQVVMVTYWFEGKAKTLPFFRFKEECKMVAREMANN